MPEARCFVAFRCGAIGGGLGDALLVADRCSAEALHAVAPAVQGCKVVDAAGQNSGAVMSTIGKP